MSFSLPQDPELAHRLTDVATRIALARRAGPIERTPEADGSFARARGRRSIDDGLVCYAASEVHPRMLRWVARYLRQERTHPWPID